MANKANGATHAGAKSDKRLRTTKRRRAGRSAKLHSTQGEGAVAKPY